MLGDPGSTPAQYPGLLNRVPNYRHGRAPEVHRQKLSQWPCAGALTGEPAPRYCLRPETVLTGQFRRSGLKPGVLAMPTPVNNNGVRTRKICTASVPNLPGQVRTPGFSGQSPAGLPWYWDGAPGKWLDSKQWHKSCFGFEMQVICLYLNSNTAVILQWL